jgi:hypothetical protein
VAKKVVLLLIVLDYLCLEPGARAQPPDSILGVWDGTTQDSSGKPLNVRFIFRDDGIFMMSARWQNNYGWDHTGRYQRSGDLYSLIWQSQTPPNNMVTSFYRLSLQNGFLSMQCLERWNCMHVDGAVNQQAPPILLLRWQGLNCGNPTIGGQC